MKVRVGKSRRAASSVVIASLSYFDLLAAIGLRFYLGLGFQLLDSIFPLSLSSSLLLVLIHVVVHTTMFT